MKQISKLILLSLLRVNELGQDAFTAHESCMRWNVKEPNAIEITKLSIKCKTALEKQKEWVDAIMEAISAGY